MMTLVSRFSAHVLCTSLLVAFSRADCYFPDGTLDADGYPCNNTAGVVTHCCRTFEACLAKGICYTQWDSQLYRRSCTDENWGDGCPTVCTDVDRAGGNGILACSQGTDPTYCCGNGSTTCCSPSNEFEFIPGDFLGVLDAQGTLCPPLPPATTITRTSTANDGGQMTSPTSSSPNSSATNNSSMTAAGAAASQTLSPSGSNDSSNARTIGLAVGIPLGILLIASIAGLFWFFNRRLNQEKAERTKLEEKLTRSNDPSRPELGNTKIWEKDPAALSDRGPMTEIGVEDRRHEMAEGSGTSNTAYEVGTHNTAASRY